MSRPTSRLYLFSCLIASAAVLLAANHDNPWTLVAPGLLFVFVFFPRWRLRLFLIVDKLVGKLIGRGNDSCDPK